MLSLVSFNNFSILFCVSNHLAHIYKVCPDEINHREGDVTNLFVEYFGKVFHLGGLAGIPFTGKTGFGAFSHHVPDDGNLFILLSSHIGISKSLKLGR